MEYGHRGSDGSICVYDVYRVTTCRPGRGILWRPPAYSLLYQRPLIGEHYFSRCDEMLLRGRHPDVNIYANFDIYRLRGFDWRCVTFFISPLTSVVGITTLSHYDQCKDCSRRFCLSPQENTQCRPRQARGAVIIRFTVGASERRSSYYMQDRNKFSSREKAIFHGRF